MPDSLRKLALDKVAAAINGSSFFVTKARGPLFSPERGSELPAVFVWGGGDDNVEGAGLVGESESQLLYLRAYASCIVTASDGPDLEDQISAARAEVLDQIGGAVNSSGALDPEIDFVRYVGSEDPVYEDAPGGAPMAEITLNFRLEYHEAHLNPYERG